MKREMTRRYRMSDAALVQKADSVRNSAIRDATELAAYGVNNATLKAIGNARDIFAACLTDEELSGDMIIATQAKNEQKAMVQVQIRQVVERARIKYGENDGRFRKFGADLLSRQNDDETVRTGRRVVRAATALLPELTSEGLNKAMITTLANAVESLDALIDAQDDAVKNRDVAVDERIALANTLYELLQKLAAKGKLCWMDLNEAKYNDYILSDNRNSGNITEGAVPAGSVVNISITGVSAATVLTLSNTGDEDLHFYFAAKPTGEAAANAGSVVAAGTYKTLSAADLGYNETTMFTRLNVHNDSAAAGAYEVEWV